MIKKAIIATIILNSIIFIGSPAGHGGGIMLLFEFVSIPTIIKKGIEFEGSLLIIGLVSLLGKIMLIISLFYKNILDKKYLIYAGLFLMLISFLVVAFRAWDYDNFLFAITLGSGIPFLMYFGRVIYLINKEKKLAELKID